MDHRETQHPERMTAQNGPVSDDEEQARSDEGREENDDGEIPDLVRIQVKAAGCVECCSEGDEHSQGRKSAVGGNDKTTDVEEDGMHLHKG